MKDSNDQSPQPKDHLKNSKNQDDESAKLSDESMAAEASKKANEKAASNQSPMMVALKGFASVVSFIAAVVVLAVLINVFLFQSYYVDGTSMMPTLQNNNRLIINKIPKTIADITGHPYIPKRGDIIVFNSSLIGPSGSPEQLIKRVIGLPGERVVVKNGVVTVFNKQNPKGFNVNQAIGLHLAPSAGSVNEVVPKDQFFVCGDNRALGGSYDSRFGLGTVPSSQIIGQMVLRVYPLNEVHFF
ncbi:MAG TPA: signal peptidase I [Candidatus Saccharimonadales bacterium]|nr:signal peptidase I [Candidatus Saccharimonadales bacterium]